MDKAKSIELLNTAVADESSRWPAQSQRCGAQGDG
jgi:hypothetical protein